MLRNMFDPNKCYRVVVYLRMSSNNQNPRSPEQQLKTIEDLIKRLGLPWSIVKIYRDDAKSGRYKRKRPGFQAMLRDLKSGEVQADLVLVDTFERLSRGDDNAEIRRKIARAGALVLTADSQFSDPTSVSGNILSQVEAIRASEESRVKAHNVLRGKRDAIQQGHWPGGTVPFGFRLKNVMVTRNGVEEVDHRVIKPIPEHQWILERIYQLAADENFGSIRICKDLNANPDIPEEFKPFSAATISSIVENELYYGEMVWGKNCTGIVDDVRILQPLPEEDWIRNPDLCEPIIDREQWDRVAERRVARRRASSHCGSSRCADTLVPRSRGVALKYPLSGLVVCSSCGRSMKATSGGEYETVTGEKRRYVSYVCTGHYSGECDNDTHVPESWLRETVINLIRGSLFPTGD